MDKQIKPIKSFWGDQAKKYGTKHDASWSDILVAKEIDVLASYMEDGDNVLDVGCANGYSSIRIAEKKNINLLGVDYAPQMVKNADIAKKNLPSSLRKKLTFQVGDALDLKFKPNTFDKVLSIRCICNLQNWKNQQKAILSMWKVLKPGGILLLSEPTVQGLSDLNTFANRFGLKPIQAPWHNFYVDEDKLLKFARPYFNVKINHFSSTYYFFSRVLYRFLMQDDVSRLKRDSLFNKIGLVLPAIGTIGVQRLYVLQKKEK